MCGNKNADVLNMTAENRDLVGVDFRADRHFDSLDLNSELQVSMQLLKRNNVLFSCSFIEFKNLSVCFARVWICQRAVSTITNLTLIVIITSIPNWIAWI